MIVKLVKISLVKINLKSLRKQAKISQTDLAKQLNIAREHLNRIENEKTVCQQSMWNKMQKILKNEHTN